MQNPTLKIEIDNLNSFNYLKFPILDKSTIPKLQAIYLIFDDTGVIYVGSTVNLYNRIISHNVIKSHYKLITGIAYKEFNNYEEMLMLEKLYIYYYFKGFSNPLAKKIHFE